MSDPSVSDRRIRPIQDAIASENWRQALKECDKWQKKGEKSDKFLALKAFVLVNQPDHTQTERGQAETLHLCHRSPAVTDIEAIHFLQDSLKGLSIKDEEAPKLWDRAAAARPTDQGLLMTWLHESIAESDWRSAQKAAMALRKAFPKDRQYEFWNILMYFLVSKDVSAPEKDRTLLGTLAYRLISKAAESIPTDPEQLLSPGKAISTPEELYLLVHIYLETGHASEAVGLLQGQTLNEESRAGQQDPQLHNTLLLKALETSQRWTDAFVVCKKMITNPEHRADDRVWLLLFKAGLFPEQKEEYASLISEYTTKRQLRCRPAQLTRLMDLRRPQDPTDRNSIPHADLLLMCTQYYRLHKDKSICYDDLKGSFATLDAAHQKEFKTFLDEEVEQAPTTWNRLFQLKYERLTEPLEENDQEEDTQEARLLTHASRSIDLYQSSLTETPACPEAGLLAAMDLLLLSATNENKSTDYLLRAILILELCRSKFEDYYPYSILLIQCYINIGLISLAMEVFVKLSIKNLQWEYVAHTMLTRISSLNPHQYGKGENSFNPSGALEAGQVVLERSNDALNRGIQDGLKHGSYSNIIDSVELKRDLEKSLNRQLYALEDRKIGRLVGEADADDGILMVRAQKTVDKRDYSFLPRYSKLDQESYDMLRAGPLPGEAWIDAMALVQYLISWLKSDYLSAQGMGKLNQFVALAGPPDRIREELTVSEWRVYEVAMLVQGIVHDILRGKAGEAADVVKRIKGNLEALVEQSEGRLEDGEDVEGCIKEVGKHGKGDVGVKVPGWEYLHTSYVQFELGCVVSAFVGWFTRYTQGKGKGKKGGRAVGGLRAEDVLALKKVLNDLEGSIKGNARRVKKGLSEGGVLGRLVDVAMAREEEGAPGLGWRGWRGWREEMGKLVGDDEVVVETVVGRWMESWEDALEGIGRVNVKLGK